MIGGSTYFHLMSEKSLSLKYTAKYTTEPAFSRNASKFRTIPAMGKQIPNNEENMATPAPTNTISN
jgi:hypothetical protein